MRGSCHLAAIPATTEAARKEFQNNTTKRAWIKKSSVAGLPRKGGSGGGRDTQMNWKRWGPYLSERQWATVREDYSPDGNCWDYFPHDHARSRAYRWGEDGLLGITDRQCRLCFALALWNGKDPILKERLFGLTGPEGNHGEDVKELYYYLDSTPTHSYMKALYKYPQAEFPYGRLVEENRRRGLGAPEFELIDTGVFDEDRYFDVFAEYAKARRKRHSYSADDRKSRPGESDVASAANTLVSQYLVVGRNTEECTAKPSIALERDGLVPNITTISSVITSWPTKVTRRRSSPRTKRILRVFTVMERSQPFVKDAFHDHVVRGRTMR